MSNIDLSDSQLPPDELAEVKERLRQEKEAEQEHERQKWDRVRLCFGCEEYFRSGLGLSYRPLPLIELKE